MDSDPFVASRLRMTRQDFATQDDAPGLRDSGWHGGHPSRAWLNEAQRCRL